MHQLFFAGRNDYLGRARLGARLVSINGSPQAVAGLMAIRRDNGDGFVASWRNLATPQQMEVRPSGADPTQEFNQGGALDGAFPRWMQVTAGLNGGLANTLGSAYGISEASLNGMFYTAESTPRYQFLSEDHFSNNAVAATPQKDSRDVYVGFFCYDPAGPCSAVFDQCESFDHHVGRIAQYPRHTSWRESGGVTDDPAMFTDPRIESNGRWRAAEQERLRIYSGIVKQGSGSAGTDNYFIDEMATGAIGNNDIELTLDEGQTAHVAMISGASDYAGRFGIGVDNWAVFNCDEP